ncbi:MAG TPA: hypothetical protein VF771_17615, partial [Longimicrobiaceae bacterium]
VLEAALKAWISQRAASVPEIGILADGVSAYKLEQAAAASGLLTAVQKATASRLRRARNQVVHGEPNCDLTAEEALEILSGLLKVLFPS